MISSDKYYDNHAATKRMSDLVEKLSIEEQRILTRKSISASFSRILKFRSGPIARSPGPPHLDLAYNLKSSKTSNKGEKWFELSENR